MKSQELAARRSAVAASAAEYRGFLRQPILTWGATPEAGRARLPGDELLEGADGVDWIENVLGLDMHSADRVLPEFQHPELGDGFGFGANRMAYAIVDPERVLAIRSADGTGSGHSSSRSVEAQTAIT